MTKRQRWAAVRSAGYSGASLALRLGVSKQTVCRHLNGTQYSAETAEAIAGELGLTAAEMWPKQARKAA